MKSDFEISKECKKEHIEKIAEKLSINNEFLECYGKYKSKIDLKILDEIKDNENGKLILVTGINPTPFGEGKTTMTIGINDALCKLNKKSVSVLREPSLGLVFGLKGGATGGEYSQVVPMEDINLHFTGDFHAVTACNNLLCALVDNHIFQGNELNIDKNKIMVNRCIDITDRSLRNIITGVETKTERHEKFNITSASEIMAILCLSESQKDLKEKLGNILIGFNMDGEHLFVKNLPAEDALTIVLKDALKPNLVQTLENNPVIIHGGPFANIAHGCNSLIATKMALKLGDYIITEAGSGSDLGAEKFFDIKCRLGNLQPDVIVINASIKALKYYGGCEIEKITNESLDYLKKGIPILKIHIENMKKYFDNIIICINKFETDTANEINFVKKYCKQLNVEMEVNTSFKQGSAGSIKLAEKIISLSQNKSDFNLLYEVDEKIENKINKICKEMYRTEKVIYNPGIKEKIELLEKYHLDKLPICMAKSHFSIGDYSKNLKTNKDDITVSDIYVSNGAGFIVVILNNISTLPGFSKKPAALNMKIDDDKIEGLF